MPTNCPHCGSKYIQYRRTEDSIQKTSKIYYCQNCKKEFSDDTAKATESGTWLFTLYGDKGYNRYKSWIKFYRKTDGSIYMEQNKDGKYTTINRAFAPHVQYNNYTSKYYIWCSTFGHANDGNGMHLSVERVELSPELNTKAQQNEAMRIFSGSSADFTIGSQPDAVLYNDVCAWFRDILGVSASGGGCYVATAVYGSYNCPQVWTLRRFRDETLAATWYGRGFIRAYYAVSPTLVKWFGQSRWFRALWKAPLDRMVSRLNARGVEDTPYQDKPW